MGRLSTFAKNRILAMRFQKCFRIKQIAQSLITEDNIKVSRKSISTFLKKYIETKSINDKPRSGRNKKLTPEEINLIGEVTRLNRDITAPKIKEYLNLNVSTYTILRASKLFEWNKFNPNSNQAKREAAMQRTKEPPPAASSIAAVAATADDSGPQRKRPRPRGKVNQPATSLAANNNHNGNHNQEEHDNKSGLQLRNSSSSISITNENESHDPKDEHLRLPELTDEANLGVIEDEEVSMAKNLSSSPMVFTTKILYKLFRVEELLGHNVSGKTFNKFIKNKKALDERRINYIRWLIERNFETTDRVELWKQCRTAINKSIRNHEIKAGQYGNWLGGGEDSSQHPATGSHDGSTTTIVKLSNDLLVDNDETPVTFPVVAGVGKTASKRKNSENNISSNNTLINLKPTMTIVQMTNDLPPTSSLEEEMIYQNNVTSNARSDVDNNNNNNNNSESSAKNQFVVKLDEFQHQDNDSASETAAVVNGDDSHSGLLITESELAELRSSCCSPMIFSTRIVMKLYTKEELIGHSVLASGPSSKANKSPKQALDEERMSYIKQLVDLFYVSKSGKNLEEVWTACRKAINRVIRNFEIKESQLIKSIEGGGDGDGIRSDSSAVVAQQPEHQHVGVKTRKYKLMIMTDHHSATAQAKH